MYLSTNSWVIGLVGAAFCIPSAQASRIHARNAMDEPSVVFYDDVALTGASYSPATIIPGDCHTLPGNWLDRAESLQIGPGYTCTFFVYAGCEGVGQELGDICDSLSAWTDPPLYNNIESFSCNKQVVPE